MSTPPTTTAQVVTSTSQVDASCQDPLPEDFSVETLSVRRARLTWTATGTDDRREMIVAYAAVNRTWDGTSSPPAWDQKPWVRRMPSDANFTDFWFLDPRTSYAWRADMVCKGEEVNAARHAWPRVGGFFPSIDPNKGPCSYLGGTEVSALLQVTRDHEQVRGADVYGHHENEYYASGTTDENGCVALRFQGPGHYEFRASTGCGFGTTGIGNTSVQWDGTTGLERSIEISYCV
jgi:hypothetical protein